MEINYKQKKICQIASLKIDLYDHQLKSIYNMELLESNNYISKDSNEIKETKIGINSDISGYGKTLSMIGLIVRDKMEWDLEIPYVFQTVNSEAKGRIKNYNITRMDRIKTTLILVPNNIVSQWVNELEKSSLKYNCLVSKKQLDEHINVEEFDVIITVPNLVNRLIRNHNKFAWKRFIYDEPSHIKFHLDEIHAGFYWFVTWCPHNIYTLYKNKTYSFGFMKDLFAITNDFSSLIKDIEIKNDDNFVKSCFKIPKIVHLHYYCKEDYTPSFRKFESHSISKMIILGQIKDAILLIGGSVTSNVKKFVKDIKLQELDSITDTLRKEHLLNQINLIDERFDDCFTKNCPICYNNLNQPILELNCQQLFCGECFLKWFQIKGSCPTCRFNILPKNLVYIDNDNNPVTNFDEYNNNNLLTKINFTVDLINKNPDSKFIIYNEKDYNKLLDSFFDVNIKYLLLKGNCKTREKNLNEFKNENSNFNILIFNNLNELFGLNLIEVTDIILFHEITTSNEEHLISIANRVGRTNKLKIHNLHILNHF